MLKVFSGRRVTLDRDKGMAIGREEFKNIAGVQAEKESVSKGCFH
jgi:hypothetical protein